MNTSEAVRPVETCLKTLRDLAPFSVSFGGNNYVAVRKNISD